MPNEQKPIMTPDHVLSLVVLLISAFLIIGATYLYRAQADYYDSGALIQKAADRSVRRLILKRQLNQDQPESKKAPKPVLQ